MISRIYAEFLREIRRLGGDLSFEQETALVEFDPNFGPKVRVDAYGRKRIVYQY